MSSALPLLLLLVLVACALYACVRGGWLSSRLLLRGWQTGRARKTAMFVCALFALPIAFAAHAPNLWVAVLLIGVDSGNFWSIMQSRVDVWRDVGNGVVKSCVFGVICTFVALYQGHETQATPEGVAYATTRTVVIASLGVLAMDFILTALMFSTP